MHARHSATWGCVCAATCAELDQSGSCWSSQRSAVKPIFLRHRRNGIRGPQLPWGRSSPHARPRTSQTSPAPHGVALVLRHHRRRSATNLGASDSGSLSFTGTSVIPSQRGPPRVRPSRSGMLPRSGKAGTASESAPASVLSQAEPHSANIKACPFRAVADQSGSCPARAKWLGRSLKVSMAGRSTRSRCDG